MNSMRRDTRNFRRLDLGIAILFFGSLFLVSTFSFASERLWLPAYGAFAALGFSVAAYRRRPGVVITASGLTVFSEWFQRSHIAYGDIADVAVHEGSYREGILVHMADGSVRRLPHLGVGLPPTRHERHLLKELDHHVSVVWNS